MSITTRERFEVLRRCWFRCYYCGHLAADGAELEIDHVVPRSHGGTDHVSNLVAACAKCNGGKSNMGPDPATVVDVALRAHEDAALRRAALASHLEEMAEAVASLRLRWDRPDDDRLIAAIQALWWNGLDLAGMHRAVDMAIEADEPSLDGFVKMGRRILAGLGIATPSAKPPIENRAIPPDWRERVAGLRSQIPKYRHEGEAAA